MTEKEKQLILERLRVEAEIRSQLGPPARKYGWLQSPLSLLVAGFLLTGLLVPLLQFSQETLKWKRQNRYDNTKYQLSMMRDLNLP